MLVAAIEQVSKGLMSSLNWAIKRSERLASMMEVKCRGAEREKPNCSGLRSKWSVREEKKV